MSSITDKNSSCVNECSSSERERILELLPQKPPFLFIDEILELSQNHIVARKKFTGEEEFYKGHFPNDPITPGVILIETMAQAALVALGLYLIVKEGREDPQRLRTLFTECSVEFLEIVKAGEEVVVKGEKIFWRMNKLKSKASLFNQDGKVVAKGELSGLGVYIS